MQRGLLRVILSAVLIGGFSHMPAVRGAGLQEQAHSPYRTLNDRLTPREYATLADWRRRAAYLREHILASAGLLPLPDRTPLRPHVFGEVRRRDYSVSKVYFESLPG